MKRRGIDLESMSKSQHLISASEVCELWQWDLHITSAKRAKIIADCILGSWTAWKPTAHQLG